MISIPRIARSDYNTCFFHIMVQGIRKEYIFNDKYDKIKYIDLLCKYIDVYVIKIISYCVMDNHTHLAIYVKENSELSGFMRAVNTTYAMYYNKKYHKVGYTFRNRYKAEPIYNEKYLRNCIHYIHDNPVKAKICKTMDEYEYSSYVEYKFNKGALVSKSKGIFPEINDLFINSIDDSVDIDYTFMDYEEDVEFVSKQDVISNFLANNHVEKNMITSNKTLFENLVTTLKEKCNITHKEIADEFGVSRIKITRILNKHEQKVRPSVQKN